MSSTLYTKNFPETASKMVPIHSTFVTARCRRLGGAKTSVWMAGHGPPVPTEEILAALKTGKEFVDTAVGSPADTQRRDAAAKLLDQ